MNSRVMTEAKNWTAKVLRVSDRSFCGVCSDEPVVWVGKDRLFYSCLDRDFKLSWNPMLNSFTLVIERDRRARTTSNEQRVPPALAPTLHTLPIFTGTPSSLTYGSAT